MSFSIIESYFQLFKTGFFFMKNPLSLSLSNPWCDVRFTVFHIANQFVSCKSISLYWFGVWIIISTHNNWRASLFLTSCECYGNVMLTNKKSLYPRKFQIRISRLNCPALHYDAGRRFLHFFLCQTDRSMNVWHESVRHESIRHPNWSLCLSLRIDYFESLYKNLSVERDHSFGRS